MSRSPKTLLLGLALIPVLAGGFVFQQQSTQQGARLLDQVLNIVSSRFVDTVDAATLYEKAARGLVRELNDPYSVLLSPKELSAFNAQTNGRYAGIGMEIAETRSEEHTSELQSLAYLVCRLLLEKKNKKPWTRDQQGL